MSKSKLTLIFIFVISFALGSKEVGSSEAVNYGSNAILRLSASNRTSANGIDTAATFNKFIAGKSHVKTRYMGGSCSVKFYSFSFPPIIRLFSLDQGAIWAYCFIPPHSRFLFSLRGPPINQCA
jgi:hypothetical protein